MGKDLRNKELGLGISQRKDGVYVARFTNRAGKRIFFCDTNLSLLRRKFEKAKVEDYENRSVASGSYTLKEWYNFWIKNYKIPNEVTPQYIEHLNATFNKYILLKDRGNIDLRDLRNIDIQLMVNEAKENSISASRNLLSILKQMLELAYENDLIVKNPAKSVHIKKPKRKSTESMSRKDEKMLLKHISSQQVRDMVLMMLNTGLRISELLGLSFDEVNLEERYIEIGHQLSYKRNEEREYIFTQTKNKKKRIIPINDVTFEILNRVIKKREKQLGKTYRGKGAISDQLVFVTVYGDAYCRSGFNSTLNYSINKTLKSGYEFECPRLSPYIFRHTFATRCLEAGMSPNTVSSLLGHGTIRMTLSYVHNSPEKFKEDTSLLNRI